MCSRNIHILKTKYVFSFAVSQWTDNRNTLPSVNTVIADCVTFGV